MRQFRRVYDLEVDVVVSQAVKAEMKKDDDSTSYAIWPFRSAEISVNGDRNNGGIDLVANPELIDIIHEATEENGLRELLIAMNKPGRAFMTLGCIAGDVEGVYYTYVEFTPRDPVIARDEDLIKAIYPRWLEWNASNCAAYPGLADALRSNVEWVYRAFSFREKAPQFLITIYSRVQSAQDHRALISWVHNFLCSVDLVDLQRAL
ncbi:hypothetical protein [Pseudomonas brassicacearum]|uniref:hypothetical protein n=1 Tax=Pseudomonas brassicacearum TaxID=930166 RepID=UPI001BDDE93D|nr:hypothetical protein [Pseudomonas brassicacearum]